MSIRDYVFYPNSILLKRRLHSSIAPVLLIGTPIHKNLGDHLIADNELIFLKSVFPKRDVIEIPTDVFFDNESVIVKNTPRDALIIITGGGWMGDLWIEDEYRMQRIISDYKNLRIVIFPQTMYYSNSKDNTIKNSAINVYKTCSNLTMLLRDRKSYDYAFKEFGKLINHILLVPDMGLYNFFDKYEIHNSIKRIGLCLREDREQVADYDFKENIKRILTENGYEVYEFSTISKHGVPTWRRKNRISKLIDEIHSFDCVITDRLHGMVFSVVSGTRCIAFDNITHKVAGVFNEWLSGNPYTIIAMRDEAAYLCDALQSLKEVNEDNIWQEKLNDGFKTIANVLLIK